MSTSVNKIQNVYKPVGLTPLEAINLLKEKYPYLETIPCTYAGRLDPMAEGVLLVLTGNTVHQKDEYLHLDKIYQAEVLLGISTDTGDLLGIPHFADPYGDLPTNIKNMITGLAGPISLPLPAYASVPVQGKPLHEWARANELDKISIPERTTAILSSELIKTDTISSDDLMHITHDRIAKISGDFRQKNIITAWERTLKANPVTYHVLTIQVKVTSGTYIRSLAEHIGSLLGTKACLLSLLRRTVGPYSHQDSIILIE